MKSKITNVKTQFVDSLKNLYNNLINERNPQNQNVFVPQTSSSQELRDIYKNGLANKIVRLKSSYALTNTMDFKTQNDEDFYRRKLEIVVRDAVTFMMAFGRGVILLNYEGDDLAQPLSRTTESELLMAKAFSGDMVTVQEVNFDIADIMYNKPLIYLVNSRPVHHTRIIDYTYIEPTPFNKIYYQYGGISEFELIKGQLINDGIIERAGARIIEINSIKYYKMKGFKGAIQSKKYNDVTGYMRTLENGCSLFGAGIIDIEDEVFTISQTLADFKEVNENSLRRIAMVTDIPLAILIGENVKGLNSTGDNELKIFQDAIKNLQNNYIFKPTNELLAKFDKNPLEFKETQWQTPSNKATFESIVLDNAKKLYELGGDFQNYLNENQIKQDDFYKGIFDNDEEAKENFNSQGEQELGYFTGDLYANSD